MTADRDPLAGLGAVLPAIAAAAPWHDRDGTVPRDSLALLHQAGFAALTVPAALGGGGAGLRLAAEAIARIGAACPATALILAMQYLKQAALARSPAWPEPLKRQLGREAVEEGALVNAIRVEPELGSPTRGGLPATTARRSAGGWVISGRKRYATGIGALRWLEVFARTEEAAPRIGSFLVPAGAPGVTVVESWNHLGLRGSGSHDLVLEAVEIPADHAIGLAPPGGATLDPVQAVWNGVLVPAVYTGIARAARDWVVQFLRSRVPSGLGAPLATLPRMQEAVGRIEALLAANARIMEALALATDAGTPPAPAEAAALQAVLVENAVRAVEGATLLAGNHAHDRAFPLERHWRDVQCARIHAPTADAAHLAAGRAALAETAA
ncbi:acyl-CoA/acyl-ACP dehydrogenase [Siccirubricoccus sp. KC 17139]|uniref:Acyl-CoA/acyl-ACP dehydrogenase n=1 Tax=Siccirubricoccus soli TaxID=2899147 RepID=A0ABT1D765_9PROT|nr:acyl-CoA dehydrogenase family protein [Siccirubricoccus soli]MCO6417771.1 acyl-CoA/acyl-ACP dehydrogenase [Siccirubricoccus soli]MCP2683906.1 acyl-CoA/acyl-ACP dehydrogenase [Siccirubricoccus soli]